MTVYNLSVHDDESFVAGGLVVHNCTEGPLQVWQPGLTEAIQDIAREILATYRK